MSRMDSQHSEAILSISFVTRRKSNQDVMLCALASMFSNFPEMLTPKLFLDQYCYLYWKANFGIRWRAGRKMASTEVVPGNISLRFRHWASHFFDVIFYSNPRRESPVIPLSSPLPGCCLLPWNVQYLLMALIETANDHWGKRRTPNYMYSCRLSPLDSKIATLSFEEELL